MSGSVMDGMVGIGFGQRRGGVAVYIFQGVKVRKKTGLCTRMLLI